MNNKDLGVPAPLPTQNVFDTLTAEYAAYVERRDTLLAAKAAQIWATVSHTPMAHWEIVKQVERRSAMDPRKGGPPPLETTRLVFTYDFAPDYEAMILSLRGVRDMDRVFSWEILTKLRELLRALVGAERMKIDLDHTQDELHIRFSFVVDNIHRT